MSVLETVLVLSLAAQAGKPSPFSARKSDPDIPLAAPVSPVSPTGRPQVRHFASPALAAGAPSSTISGGYPRVVTPTNRSSFRADSPVPPAPIPPEPSPAKPVPPEPPSAEAVTAVVVLRQAPQFGAVRAGMLKKDALALLGPPVTAIQMYEDTVFLESFRYEWKGAWAGTVRLADGKVSRVDLP